MIKYPDGTEARVGDRVSLSHDADSGVVTEVFDSLEKAETWNLDKTGLMIESVATGLTFYPERSLDEDEIRFVSRVVAS
jgi:hypothetical protein